VRDVRHVEMRHVRFVKIHGVPPQLRDFNTASACSRRCARGANYFCEGE